MPPTLPRFPVLSQPSRSLGALLLCTTALAAPPSLAQDDADRPQIGRVFVLTNTAADNRVAVFLRLPIGATIPFGSVSTGGHGTGSPLDSQGALALGDENRFLYAANPGSDEITVFRVGVTGINPIQIVPSGGDLPVSLTRHAGLLYALNAGPGGTNITGFRIGANGTLTALAGSTRMLTTPIGAPAQVQFDTEGEVLVVTHKATDTARPPENIIDTFTVGSNGLPSPAMPQASNGLRPFGFAIRPDGTLVVSEAINGVAAAAAASSYDLGADGSLTVISGSVGNSQTGSCWLALTPNGRFAYVTNTPAGTLSSYTVGTDGSLTLLGSVAANPGLDSQPEDMAVTGNGRFLHVVLAGLGRLATYRINDNGSLTLVDTDGGFPAMAGATGIAAF